MTKEGIRNRIFDILYWLLCLVDKAKLENLKIGTKSVIETSKFIPIDNKWHDFAYTVEYWIKRDNKDTNKVERIDSLCVYRDGKLKEKEIHFSHPK